MEKTKRVNTAKALLLSILCLLGSFASPLLAQKNIAGGSYHSIALCNDGTVRVCGYNVYGQVGDNTTTNRTTPVQVQGTGGTGFLTNILAVAAGSHFNLVLKNDGTVWAWGYNGKGQLGNNTTNDKHTPVQVVGSGGTGFLSGITAIACGGEHALALKNDGTVWTWGNNTNGQLGDNTNTTRNAPVQVLGTGGIGFLIGITAIAGGNYYSLALKNDGTVWAWGNNGKGQLGNNLNIDNWTPIQVKGTGGTGFLTNITAIAAGSDHSLALKNDGTVWAWGNDAKGQLGDNASTNSWTPVQVLGTGGTGTLSNITAIAAGYNFSIALKSDGTLWTWGDNWKGQLGDNTTIDRGTPVQVLGIGGTGFLTDIAAIASGSYHTLALKNDGTLWSWGYGAFGQLGDNASERHTPAQMNSLCSVNVPTGLFNFTENKEGIELSNIFPNPTENELEYIVSSICNSEVVIKAIDVLGKQVILEKIIVQKGENKLHLDIKNLSSGMYVLQITTASGLYLDKAYKSFIKNR